MPHEVMRKKKGEKLIFHWEERERNTFAKVSKEGFQLNKQKIILPQIIFIFEKKAFWIQCFIAFRFVNQEKYTKKFSKQTCFFWFILLQTNFPWQNNCFFRLKKQNPQSFPPSTTSCSCVTKGFFCFCLTFWKTKKVKLGNYRGV